MINDSGILLPSDVYFAATLRPVAKGVLLPSMSFFKIVAYSMGMSSVKGSTLLPKVFLKKSQEPEDVKAGIPKRFADSVPSMRNFRARAGISPVESSCRFAVSERRRITSSVSYE